MGNVIDSNSKLILKIVTLLLVLVHAIHSVQLQMQYGGT